MGRALYLIPLQTSIVKLYSSATAIQTLFQWKYYDLPIYSIPRIDLDMIGQCFQPLINKSPVHNGAMNGPVQL